MMTLNFMGDVMLGELLETYRRGLITTLEKSGHNPFAHVQSVLEQGDLNVINLECVFSDTSCLHPPFNRILIAPEKFLPILTENKINVVNTANNHALDHGEAAFARSCSLVQEQGIHIVGYTPTCWFQEDPVVIEMKGHKIGFLGYNISNFSDDEKARSIDRIESVTGNARDSVDKLVVSLHWGEEYTHIPPPYIVSFGRRILSAGCDILHGHHSHQIQGVHQDGRKIFAPSLGNFIFDQMIPENRITAILQICWNDQGLAYTYLPHFLNDDFQPEPAPQYQDHLAEINRLFAESLFGQAENKYAVAIEERVRAGHQKNRLRMRAMMFAHFWDYLPYLREIVEFRKGTRRLFSVIDGEDSLPGPNRT